jgi:hypothetical protein
MRSRDELLRDKVLVENAKGRFWSKLIADGSCVVYTGPKTHNGYGEFWLGENNVRAHRYAFTIAKGKIPYGMIVMHTCDNPACCNPDYLILGTVEDNIQDRVAKGRSGGAHAGSAHHKAKLTEDQVQYAANSKESQVEVARRLGVSQSVISRIRSKKAWRSVTA